MPNFHGRARAPCSKACPAETVTSLSAARRRDRKSPSGGSSDSGISYPSSPNVRSPCLPSRGRHRDASRPRPLRQIVGLSPDRLVYRELRKRARELLEKLLFPLPAGAVPEFELHQGTPACLSTGQGCFDATPHCRVAVRTKHVYPARRVDQDHGSASATLGLEFFGCNQVVASAGVLDQLGHAHAAIEVGDGADNGLTLGLRIREPDGILKFAVRNINCGLHAQTLAKSSTADNAASIALCLALAS